MRGCPRLMRCQILMPVDGYAGNQTLLGYVQTTSSTGGFKFFKLFNQNQESDHKIFQEKILFNKKFCS